MEDGKQVENSTCLSQPILKDDLHEPVNSYNPSFVKKCTSEPVAFDERFEEVNAMNVNTTGRSDQALFDEIICHNSPTVDNDSLSTATAGSVDADSEVSINSKGVKRAGRRSKNWLSDEGKPSLSYELQLGVRILGSFMVESLKSNTAPFMDRVDEEVAPRYYDIVQHPVWLNMSKNNSKNKSFNEEFGAYFFNSTF